MLTNQDIVSKIKAHCECAGIAVSTFGRKVVNDGKLVSRLEAGKSITLETYRRIHDEIEKFEEPV